MNDSSLTKELKHTIYVHVLGFSEMKQDAFTVCLSALDTDGAHTGFQCIHDVKDTHWCQGVLSV